MRSAYHDIPPAQGQAGLPHYTLTKLLPATQQVAVRVFEDGDSILALLDGGLMVEAMTFTVSETCVLLPLLHAYPYYCPYELLFAAFTAGGVVTDEMIAAARKHLHNALYTGGFEQEMRPVRNVVSRTRLKLLAIHIDVMSILETGYMLHPPPVRPRKSREREKRGTA